MAVQYKLNNCDEIILRKCFKKIIKEKIIIVNYYVYDAASHYERLCYRFNEINQYEKGIKSSDVCLEKLDLLFDMFSEERIKNFVNTVIKLPREEKCKK